MKMQKIGGIASILNIIFLVILVLVAPRLGLVEALDDTAKVSNGMGAVFTFGLMLILGGIAYFLIVLGIKERMQDSAPKLMQALIIAVSVACALWFAAGSIGIEGLPTVVQIGDGSALTITFAIQQSLIFSGDSAAGWVILLIGWAGLKTGRLPKALSYLAVVKAIFMIPEIAGVPAIIGIIGMLLGIVFYPWLGIVLLRSKN